MEVIRLIPTVAAYAATILITYGPSCGMVQISSYSVLRKRCMVTGPTHVPRARLTGADIYMNERVAKSFVYKYSAATPGVYGVFNVIDKSAHRFKRKLVGQATSERSMRIFEPVMNEQIATFLRILLESSRSSEPVNMTELVSRLTFDTVALLAFGRPLKTQTDPTYRPLIEAQNAGNYRSNMLMQFPLLYKIKIFNFLELFAADQVFQYWNTLETMIAARMAEEKHIRHDLYSILVDQINPEGKYLKDSEIWAEAAFFFPAGADTVSALICAVFFYLARNPAAYARLADEIRSTFATSDEIKGGRQLTSCKYLRACIDETLRISPPASGTLWRELDTNDRSKEPFIVDGHVIPRGVQVGLNIYTLHHNEEYFPEPFAFRPERWLESETPAAQLKVMQEAFVPFSIGARTCSGKAMAYAETSLVLARALWYFDFELAPGELGKLGGGNRGLGEGREREDEYQLYDVLSANHDGPNLVFRSRGDLWKDLVVGDEKA
ncbi:hypothetical protein DL771_000613 [Monosporascus sp. 5C6A]|nr:hypothetical protein DL771_000613 [Monosporascus sp. 5C6A]